MCVKYVLFKMGGMMCDVLATVQPAVDRTLQQSMQQRFRPEHGMQCNAMQGSHTRTCGDTAGRQQDTAGNKATHKERATR
jgi:hypothetical protein